MNRSPLAAKLTGKHLILASRSPRRRQLIAECGLECEIAPDYEVDESYPADMEADKVAEHIASLKSAAYPLPLTGEDILITADTVVINDGVILGKPHSREEAVAMLRGLSAKRHHVVTGMVLRSAERTVRFSVSTEVWFRAMTDDEIAYYVDTMQPYDKAGAYGIQEWIGLTSVERIEGSYHNVVGLPTESLYVHLVDFLN
ncbi:MAG: septum formation protein Maf [Tidjanibacter sp.]|nr:septum formation protein Maf [Tidjanibacter sp.]